MADKAENGGRRRVSRWRIVPWAVAAFLLLLPAVAMRFGDEVTWTASDFIFMGVMLFGACGVFELAARMSGRDGHRPGAHRRRRHGHGPLHLDPGRLLLRAVVRLGLTVPQGRARPAMRTRPSMAWGTRAPARVNASVDKLEDQFADNIQRLLILSAEHQPWSG